MFSFRRLSKPEAMDDEVTQILKKWNKTYNNLHPKKDVELPKTTDPNETFDSRTFTRPKRRTIRKEIAMINHSIGILTYSILLHSHRH